MGQLSVNVPALAGRRVARQTSPNPPFANWSASLIYPGPLLVGPFPVTSMTSSASEMSWLHACLSCNALGMPY